ncbi:hypothetical protein ABIB86_000451 [Bradyrhizobium sp. JR1.7]|uniref:spike base protein, RCAP_Rcc01079 family n=1 Tax=unclassified Bradyrhizobium TaxID=2631580 RepID=UPI003397C5DC
MPARPGEALNDDTASIKSALAISVAAADSTFTGITRGIYVGVSGDVAVQFVGDADAASVILAGLAAGVWHPMQVQKVLKIGTTATGIVVGF